MERMLEKFKSLFEAFASASRKLYLVGGCVRDSIFGTDPKDFDFTTDAWPDETKEILTRAGLKPWPLGEKFGTIAVRIGDDEVEITTHRKDMTPGRHPDVAFTTNLAEDLERRDFTINSMALDGEGRLFDPFRGRTDLEHGVLRTTGSPSARFSEDPLRMLRAARFVSKLAKFSLNHRTKEAMSLHASSIMLVSRERWLEEMTKLLAGPGAYHALEILKDTGILYFVVPEMYAVVHEAEGKLHSKDLWHHTKTVVSRAVPRPEVRWAALLHDMAKPHTRSEGGGEVHFYQHENLGAEMVEGIARRLKMSNDMRRSVRGLVSLHQRTSSLVTREGTEYVVSRRALRRLLADCEEARCSFHDLVDLFEADTSSKSGHVRDKIARQAAAIRKELGAMKAEDARPRLPKGIGNLIMERFGVKGAEVGKLRDRLEQMLLDGEIASDTDPEQMLEKLG